jgi:hypothetical protein
VRRWICKLTGHWLFWSAWARTPEGWERVAHCRVCEYHEHEEVAAGLGKPLNVVGRART